VIGLSRGGHSQLNSFVIAGLDPAIRLLRMDDGLPGQARQ
jgi:hypothetical protein